VILLQRNSELIGTSKTGRGEPKHDHFMRLTTSLIPHSTRMREKIWPVYQYWFMCRTGSMCVLCVKKSIVICFFPNARVLQFMKYENSFYDRHPHVINVSEHDNKNRRQRSSWEDKNYIYSFFHQIQQRDKISKIREYSRLWNENKCCISDYNTSDYY